LPDARIQVEDLSIITDANNLLQYTLNSGNYSNKISKYEYRTMTYLFSLDITLITLFKH